MQFSLFDNFLKIKIEKSYLEGKSAIVNYLSLCFFVTIGLIYSFFIFFKVVYILISLFFAE